MLILIVLFKVLLSYDSASYFSHVEYFFLNSHFPTRSDIVDLLLDSQFLVPSLDMASLTTTVSGALDR